SARGTPIAAYDSRVTKRLAQVAQFHRRGVSPQRARNSCGVTLERMMFHAGCGRGPGNHFMTPLASGKRGATAPAFALVAAASIAERAPDVAHASSSIIQTWV